MAETEMKMAIDPFMVVRKALMNVKKPVDHKENSVHRLR